MARFRPGDVDDRDAFLAAVGDARPLRNRERAPAPRAPARPRPAPPPAPLTLERDGSRLCGRARGVNRRQLAKLRGGDPVPEATLDLHGATLSDARTRLDSFFAEAARNGLRCLRVVSGKGLHSRNGPVLRDAVADWLAGPLAARVLAFSTASDREGGDGSFHVLLRRTSA